MLAALALVLALRPSPPAAAAAARPTAVAVAVAARDLPAGHRRSPAADLAVARYPPDAVPAGRGHGRRSR